MIGTLTKRPYFFIFSVENRSCLILDQRLLDVISDNRFFELSALPKISKSDVVSFYIHYIELIKEIAEAEDYKTHQLELFLFQFGKNLKKSAGNTAKTPGL